MFEMLTLDVKSKDELAMLSAALEAMMKKDYTSAQKILIARMDALTEKANVLPYHSL